MLLLNATTDSIEIITGQTCDVDVHASYIDMTTADPPVIKGSTSGRTHKNITTATTTASVVPAPASSTIRNVKCLNIRNAHATDSVAVTVQFNQNATLYELHKVTLAAGECLEFVEGIGFFVLGAANPNFAKTLTADQSNSVTTATEVTGLSLATPTGTFFFKYAIVYQSGATTTGVRFSVNYDGTVTVFDYNVYGAQATTTASDGNADQDVALTTGGLFFVNAARAKGVAGLGASVSVDTANADMLMMIEGIAVVTVAGNFELWHASETTAISTVKAGTSLVLTKCG